MLRTFVRCSRCLSMPTKCTFFSLPCPRQHLYVLRELVKEGFPIHDDLVRTLLYNTEDEEDVADIVMYAVGNTRQDCGEMRLV